VSLRASNQNSGVPTALWLWNPALRAPTHTHTSHSLQGWGLESRPKAAARLVLDVSAGGASPSSRGVWSGGVLLPSTRVLLGSRGPTLY
jgi:hypothetical protein